MWNLDSIHKVGELTAAVAVVISLVFVGIQVRQNTEIQKQLATRSLARDWNTPRLLIRTPSWLACSYG